MKKKKNIIIIISIVVLCLLFCVIIANIPNIIEYKVDKDFRNYLSKEYNFNLSKSSYVGRCWVRRTCDYYGYYPLKEDQTYFIQTSKKRGKITASYHKEALKMRKELYNYIKELKGKNYVGDYLYFYDNGDKGHLYSHDGKIMNPLSYIVYYNNGLDMDEQIYTDYLILKKAMELTANSNNKYRKISELNVYYINDSRLLNKNWIEDLKIDVREYGNAPEVYEDVPMNFIRSSDFSDEGPYRYMKYSMFDFYYDMENKLDSDNIDLISFSEFKKKVDRNLEISKK